MFSGESQLIRWLRSRAPQRSSDVHLGIGDDAALAHTNFRRTLILTTDLSVEDVHFTNSLHPPEAVGHRALARALSDIAAMGGRPKFALVSLAVSRNRAGVWLKDFYRGLFRQARRFHVSVIGGDTTVFGGPTVVDVIVAGEVLRGRALLRSGARSGDQIFVGGRLGCSALGLRDLRAGPEKRRRNISAATRAHLFPEPQCRLGEFLSQKRIATSAMDLSDGLSIDLRRLCEASGVGARLEAKLLPLPDQSIHPGLTSHELEQAALYGGEDYKLLFTVSPKRAKVLPRKLAGVEVFKIGEVSRAAGLVLIRDDGREEKLPDRGYDHFRRHPRQV
jgi:thiamine-monophosphate kinase